MIDFKALWNLMVKPYLISIWQIFTWPFHFRERNVSMAVYPYTPAWPKDEIADAIAGVTSGKIATAHEAHCIWSIVGYGLSVVAPDPAPAPKAEEATVVKLSNATPSGAAEYLQGHLDGSIPLGAFDWASLLPILIKLLMTFFGV